MRQAADRLHADAYRAAAQVVRDADRLVNLPESERAAALGSVREALASYDRAVDALTVFEVDALDNGATVNRRPAQAVARVQEVRDALTAVASGAAA